MPRGGTPALPSFRRAAQPPAAVARLSHHQLCGYNVSGSPHRPTRGSSGEFPKRRRPSVCSAPFSPFSLFYFCFFYLQTGYMFGKGVYFADMVSKSANYCHTSQSEPVGLLLLAEVALGNMWVSSQWKMCQNVLIWINEPLGGFCYRHELKKASHITKLPKGKHSVKGQKLFTFTFHSSGLCDSFSYKMINCETFNDSNVYYATLKFKFPHVQFF